MTCHSRNDIYDVPETASLEERGHVEVKKKEKKKKKRKSGQYISSMMIKANTIQNREYEQNTPIQEYKKEWLTSSNAP